MSTIKNILENNRNNIYSFANEFNDIILSKLDNYGKGKKSLKSFLEDLQKAGCISGMIGDFVYHSDCKDFYTKHIDDLEEFKEELSVNLGEPIINMNHTKHYTFVVWLAFEEYCYSIYNDVFDN